jgi:hypothetical protein
VSYRQHLAWRGGAPGHWPPPPRDPLPAFDTSDSYGFVHTTQPPDLVIPSGPDRRFFRGDLGGVMLPTAPPFVPGANTTPPEMVMSFLLPWYQQPWIDTILMAHAERGYTHFLLDFYHCRKAGLSLQQTLDLIAYVQSWGFFTPIWLTGSNDDRSHGWTSVQPIVEPLVRGLLNASSLTAGFIAFPGQELNTNCEPGPGKADAIIAAVCALCNPSDVDCWLHFSPNYPGYPMNPQPGQNFDVMMVEWIAQWRGRIRGLAWQGDGSQSAGLMGAKMWDARRFWARAGYTDYPCVVAFELMATDELYGHCTEAQGCLRGTEMVYCTSDGSAPPVAGYGNGARRADGSVL